MDIPIETKFKVLCEIVRGLALDRSANATAVLLRLVMTAQPGDALAGAAHDVLAQGKPGRRRKHRQECCCVRRMARHPRTQAGRGHCTNWSQRDVEASPVEPQLHEDLVHGRKQDAGHVAGDTTVEAHRSTERQALA